MASYALSVKADDDIAGIARATLDGWGAAQMEAYVTGLHEACERLARFPDLGRDAASIHPGYRRLEFGRHVVFYVQTGDSILIVRVLHDRMDFQRHL